MKSKSPVARPGRFALMLVLWCLSPALSNGQCTLYVNASDGNDANAGGRTSPLRSVEYAYNIASTGTSICIDAGTYVWGDDADGIQLSVQDKSITMVLNAFAGDDVVRFSENEFEIDSGGGVLTFRSGSTDKLVLGQNSENSTGSAGWGFLHTLSLRSGTLDIENIRFQLASVVGNPDWVDPSTGFKPAPDSARIRIGQAQLVGNIVYEAGARSYLFEGLEGESPAAFELPSTNNGNRVTLSNGNAISFSRPTDLRGAVVSLENSGLVAFNGEVSIENPSTELLWDSNTSGRVEFNDGIRWLPSTSSDVVFPMSGRHPVSVKQLTLQPETSSSFSGELRYSGSGQLFVENLHVSAPSGSFGRLDLSLLDGEVFLGNSNSSTHLTGHTVVAARLDLQGDIVLDAGANLNQAEFIVSDNGFVNLGEHTLHAHSGALISVDGIISSAQEGELRLGNVSSVNGNGLIESLVVTGVAYLAIDKIGLLDIRDNAHALIAAGENVTTSSLLESATGALTIAEASTLKVEENSVLGGTIETEAESSLILKSIAQLYPSSVLTGTGTVVLSGQDVLVKASGIDLPDIRVDEGSIAYLEEPRSIESIEIVNASLEVSSSDQIGISGTLVVSGGFVSLSASGQIRAEKGFTVTEDSQLATESPEPIIIGGEIYLEDSQADFQQPGVFLTAGPVSFSGNVPITFASLSMGDDAPDLEVNTQVNIQGDFKLNSGSIKVAQSASLTIAGNLDHYGGVFDPESLGTVEFNGSALQFVNGFVGAFFPKTAINSHFAIFQSPQIRTKSLAIGEDSRLGIETDVFTVLGDFDTLNGFVSIKDGSSFSVDGATSIINTDFEHNSGTLAINGDLSVVKSRFNNPQVDVVFGSKSNQSVATDDTLYVSSITVADATQLEGVSGRFVVQNDLTVQQDASLTLVGMDIELQGRSQSPVVFNEGVINATEGRVHFLGPFVGTEYLLEGSGSWGGLSIRLDDDNDFVRLSASDDPFIVIGDLDFISGGINTEGRLISIASRDAVPVLSLNLTDEVSYPGTPDGKGFINEDGAIQFSGQSTADVTLTGVLYGTYEIPEYFSDLAIANLTITASDAVNAPAIFGVDVTKDIFITNNLHVGYNVFVNLSAGSFVLLGENNSHLINGVIEGPGVINILGGNNNLSSTQGVTSSIDRLVNRSPHDSTSANVLDFPSLSSLDIQSGFFSIGGTVDSLVIRDSFLINNSTVHIHKKVKIKDGYIGGINGNLVLGDGAFFSVEGNSDMILDNEFQVHRSAQSEDDGWINLSGDVNFRPSPSIPRLSIGSSAHGAHSNVFTLANTVITEKLSIDNGSLFIDSNDLLITSGALTIGQVTSGTNNVNTIWGDLSAGESKVRLLGQSWIELNGDLDIQFSSLHIDAGPDTTRVLSYSNQQPIIKINAQKLVIESGYFDIGTADVMLDGTLEDVLTIYSGGILGQSVTQDQDYLSSLLPNVLSEAARETLAPLDGESFGEVILAGGGRASIRIFEESIVSHLTINGSVQLSRDNYPLRTNRLLYGRDGAGILSNAPELLVIENGGTVIRQGVGALSSEIGANGTYTLVYDFQDIVSPASMRNTLGHITTGYEINDSMNSLVVLAGSHDNKRNSIILKSNIILKQLLVGSGAFDTSSATVQVEEGGSFILEQADGEMPATLVGNGIVFEDRSSAHLSIINHPLDITSTVVPVGTHLSRVDFVTATNGLNNSSVKFFTSLVADQIYFNSSLANAFFNLRGNTLIANERIVNTNTKIGSDGIGHLISLGDMILDSNSTIDPSVAVRVDGDLSASGALLGQSVEVGGDFDLRGQISPSVEIAFTGTSQKFFVDDDLNIGALILRQSTASVVDVISTSPQTLSIKDVLSFETGVLNMSENTLRIDGAVQVSGTGMSHVVGAVERNVAKGFTGSLVFPVGSLNRYRPLIMTVTEPMLTSTDLTVNHVFDAIIPQTNLPLITADGTEISNTSGYYWTLKSTVNFALSQPVNISVGTTESDYPFGNSTRLLRSSAPINTRGWQDFTETTAVTTGVDSSFITVTDVRGLLVTDNVVLTFGIQGEDSGRSAWVQFANLGDSRDEVTLSLNDNVLWENQPSSSTTEALPIVLPEFIDSLSVEYWNSDDEFRSFGYYRMTGDTWTLLTFFRDNEERPKLSSASHPYNHNSIDYQPYFSVLNASTKFDIVKVSGAGPFPVGSVLKANLLPGEQSGIMELPSGFWNFNLANFSDSTSSQSFHADFSGLQDHGIIGVITTNSQPSMDDPAFRFTLVSSDGLLLDAISRVSTEPTSKMPPASIKLTGNFPNPFSNQTTLVLDLPKDATIRVDVYDISGRLIQRFKSRTLQAGYGIEVPLDMSNHSSGVYLYHLSVDNDNSVATTSGKLVLIK